MAKASEIVSLFSANPGPLVVVTARVSGERRTERNADCGDLVFGLQSPHAEVFVLGEFVQNVTRRCDRV